MREIKLGPQLCAGSFGNNQILVKFCRTTALKTLSDIRHHRYSGSLNLIFKAKIFRKSTLRSDLIN